ncbi:hypothetical protein EROM_080350 [Encephalitozoon romaleae SJ-2008]|uniref:Uncharacterized protein n=1 Tax=Encephalitozoon romaleae (strain SJ-2008) TaxID=1178016 RepID=I7ASP1_ENCRO|nr:hypothetical protein EROM_080350 [Encephalitozoon romaleae SJ-2008]AFN83457.1 hypothetical protein EROM_080350 [Encephalitozoon romaleae SJ-2008]
MSISVRMAKAKENLKDLHEKTNEACKRIKERIKENHKSINICGIEIDSSDVLSLILIFTPIVPSILGFNNSYVPTTISIIGYLVAIIFSLYQGITKLYNSYVKYKETHSIWELLGFRNLMLLFQVAFGMFLSLHLLHITDKHRTESIGTYGLMISLVYISKLAWKLSNFSIKKDDFYQFLILLIGLVLILLATSIAWKEVTTSYIVVSALLSSMMILSDHIGEPITEKLDETEPLSAIAALLPIFTVIYVTANTIQKFKIPFQGSQVV